MYVPATPVAPAVPIAPVGLLSMTPPSIAPASVTDLRIRRERLDVLAGQPVTIDGTLEPALAGRVVDLQRLGRRGWRTITDTHTFASGRFKLRFRAMATGSALVRVRFPGDSAGLPSRHRAGVLNVFRLAGASWYGGGGSLACGGWLTSSTMGVANKTLPCGTLVTLRYDGRSVRVPVVDRGPYVAGREFDLTEATKRALGFGSTGDVWSTS
jgi:hypothetical protein